MVDYAKNRRQFGKAIAEYQLIQAMIADSYTEYRASKALVEESRGDLRRQRRGQRRKRLPRNISLPRRWAAWPTARFRCTAVPAT